MPAITTRDGVLVAFGSTELTGTLLHDDENRDLVLLTDEGYEPISISLQGYGLVPKPGHVYIKDWSEHLGLTGSLAAAGLVRPVRQVVVGTFASTAYEVDVTI